MNRYNWFPIVMVVFASSLMGIVFFSFLAVGNKGMALQKAIVQEVVKNRKAISVLDNQLSSVRQLEDGRRELEAAMKKLEQSVQALSATIDKAIANQEALSMTLDRLNKRLSEGAMP